MKTVLCRIIAEEYADGNERILRVIIWRGLEKLINHYAEDTRTLREAGSMVMSWLCAEDHGVPRYRRMELVTWANKKLLEKGETMEGKFADAIRKRWRMEGIQEAFILDRQLQLD